MKKIKEKWNGLKSSERAILTVLFLLLAVYAVVIKGMMPLYFSYLDKSDELAELQSERDSLYLYYQSLDMLEEDQTKIKNQLESIFKRLPANVDDDMILVDFNNVDLSADLKVQNIALDESQIMSMSYFTTGEDTENESSQVRSHGVSISLEGNIDSIYELINSLENQRQKVRFNTLSLAVNELQMLEAELQLEYYAFEGLDMAYIRNLEFESPEGQSNIFAKEEIDTHVDLRGLLKTFEVNFNIGDTTNSEPYFVHEAPGDIGFRLTQFEYDVTDLTITLDQYNDEIIYHVLVNGHVVEMPTLVAEDVELFAFNFRSSIENLPDHMPIEIVIENNTDKEVIVNNYDVVSTFVNIDTVSME
ncbi:hypothetical protein EZV73_11370 [Acidaminobacter sp. JC074]|uniref:hypothetical protein n=1 Tax=Acidaminobacter sp. JC074 TaxID=2530199 RepID=UPI001F0F868F|nr:hypothetical protein [Acidaminobacter sp. JC074]MCH4888177.1 hypothetical protein [Acidaminobacter sp. JC074]